MLISMYVYVDFCTCVCVSFGVYVCVTPTLNIPRNQGWDINILLLFAMCWVYEFKKQKSASLCVGFWCSHKICKHRTMTHLTTHALCIVVLCVLQKIRVLMKLLYVVFGCQNFNQNNYIISWQNHIKSSWNYVLNIQKQRYYQQK